jgi:hypothetical protein
MGRNQEGKCRDLYKSADMSIFGGADENHVTHRVENRISGKDDTGISTESLKK